MAYPVVCATQVSWRDLECTQYTPHITQTTYTNLGAGIWLPTDDNFSLEKGEGVLAASKKRPLTSRRF